MGWVKKDMRFRGILRKKMRESSLNGLVIKEKPTEAHVRKAGEIKRLTKTTL